MLAKGTFIVQLSPLEYSHSSPEHLQMARLRIEKTFEGDLQANSLGEMLSARNTSAGSAGYVAMEYLNGKLNGKSGGFALQHFGTMTKDQSQLILEIVPGSGTGQLSGISGKMSIDQTDGTHHYSLEYIL